MDDLREPFKEMAYQNIAKRQLWVDRIYEEEERSTTTRTGENDPIPNCVKGAQTQFESLCDAVYHAFCAEIAKQQMRGSRRPCSAGGETGTPYPRFSLPLTRR